MSRFSVAFRPVLQRALFYLSKKRKMASASPIEFKIYFKVHFETVIRGNHVYKHTWTSVIDHVLQCEKDSSAQELDSNAVSVYLVTTQSDAKKTLAGHVLIELSHLLKNFLEAEVRNKLCAQVRGKRKREVGLVVPALFTALISELRIARILERVLAARAEKYSHFELKNITFKENKLPMLF